MVSGAIRIGEETLAQQPRGTHDFIGDRAGERPGLRNGDLLPVIATGASGDDGRALAPQNEAAVVNADIADQLDLREAARLLPEPFAGEGPPSPGLGIAGNLPGLHGGDGLAAQRLVIDARVFDAAGEGVLGIARLQVPPSEQHHCLRAECLRRLGHSVASVFGPVAVKRHVTAMVGDRHLDEGLAIGGLGGPAPLRSPGAVVSIAAGHPLRGGKLAEDDTVEVGLGVLNRQSTAAPLGEVGGSDPGHQGLVIETGNGGLSWLRLRARRRGFRHGAGGFEDLEEDVLELHGHGRAAMELQPEDARKSLVLRIVIYHLRHQQAVDLEREVRADAKQVVLVPVFQFEMGRAVRALNPAAGDLAVGRDHGFGAAHRQGLPPVLLV